MVIKKFIIKNTIIIIKIEMIDIIKIKEVKEEVEEEVVEEVEDIKEDMAIRKRNKNIKILFKILIK